jgi:uncharacterized coiled-coil protein SlyX
MFRYKEEVDPDGAPQFGLVAEEVEKVDRELVVHDEEGKPFTVRYDAVNVMLLNEFLRQHRTVQEQAGKLREQETTITRLEAVVVEQRKVTAEQQKQIETLTNGLRNVSNQIEVLTSSPTRVAEDH